MTFREWLIANFDSVCTEVGYDRASGFDPSEDIADDGQVTCDSCDGTGDCVCNCGDYHDCHACDGEGGVDEDEVNGFPVMDALLIYDKIIAKENDLLALMEKDRHDAVSERP